LCAGCFVQLPERGSKVCNSASFMQQYWVMLAGLCKFVQSMALHAIGVRY
jgi:hypothetical protein